MNIIEDSIDKIVTIVDSISEINYIETQRSEIDKYVTAEIVRDGFTFSYRAYNEVKIILNLRINIYINQLKEIELTDIILKLYQELIKSPTLSDTCEIMYFNSSIMNIQNTSMDVLKGTCNLQVEIPYDII